MKLCLARSLLSVSAVLFMAATPAFAQSNEAAAAMRSACPSDFRSLCAGVKTGGKEALGCLQKNIERLSPACRAAVEPTLPQPAPVKAAPAPETKPAPFETVPKAKPAPVHAAPAQQPQPATPAEPMTAAPATPAQPAKPAAPATKQVTPPAPPAAPTVKQAAPPAKPAEPMTIAPPAQTAAPAVAAPSPVEQAILVKQCGLDIRAHCGHIAAGDGRVLACLMEKEANLLPRCRLTLKNVAR